jgi:hypothetical protein
MLRQLVTIEESTLLGMLVDQRYLNEFPFLLQLKAKLAEIGDCGRCGRKDRTKLQERQNALAGARLTFATLPSSRRNVLKHLLQTHKVRVIYFSGAKKIQVTY